MESFITENGFNYRSVGKGRPILILHGLMGGLSNFEDVFNFFPQKNYNVIAPELPVYTSKLLDTNVKFFAKFVNEFVKFKKLKDFVIVGNSLGGHVGLIYAKFFPNLLKGLVLTGSSGLYENSMGDSYPKREDYNFIRKKTEGVFYDPKVATKDLVDRVFKITNKRDTIIRLLAFAKSAIRHNMAEDLPKMKLPACLIWGKEDKVTPPHVAEEFHSLLPNSSLFWVDKCGHAPMWEHPKEFSEIVLKWLNANI